MTKVRYVRVGETHMYVQRKRRTCSYLHNELDVVWFIMEIIQEDLGAVPKHGHAPNKPQGVRVNVI